MRGNARIRDTCMRRLCLLCLTLWQLYGWGSEGFTYWHPPHRTGGMLYRPMMTRLWSSPRQNGGGRGGGNKPPRRGFFGGLHPEGGDDDRLPDHRLPLTIGGGAGAWLWTHLWNAKDSAYGTTPSSSHIAITAASVSAAYPSLAASRNSWKMALAAAIVLLQTTGLQAMRVGVAAVRQGTAWYLTKLSASPLVTKSITSGLIGICGDYMAQWLEYRLGRRRRADTDHHYSGNNLSIHGTYDVRRGLAILADGLFISGPLMHWGYNLFEHLMPVAQGRSLAALMHVVADSILLDSIFVGTTIAVTAVMEGYGHTITSQFQRDYADTLKASWATSATLMPLEYACFRYLPVTLRTLAMNLTDVVWDSVVSFMTHRHRTAGTAAVSRTAVLS